MTKKYKRQSKRKRPSYGVKRKKRLRLNTRYASEPPSEGTQQNGKIISINENRESNESGAVPPITISTTQTQTESSQNTHSNSSKDWKFEEETRSTILILYRYKFFSPSLNSQFDGSVDVIESISNNSDCKCTSTQR